MTTNPDLYPTQFHHYLTRNLRYVLGLVQAAGPVLNEEVRGQALHTLSYALQATAVWPLTRELFITLTPKMEQGGQREHWIPYLQEALRQSEAQGDDAAAGECHFQLALLYRLLSHFAAAHEHLQAALAHFTALGARRDQARVLNELAWLEHLQHRYDDASQHVIEALTLLEEDDPERGMGYRVQGMIAIDKERWQEAEILHQKALTIFKKEGNRRRIAWGLQNLAYALRGQNKFVESINYYKSAVDVLRELKDIHHLAIVLFNLGGTYYCCQDLDNATNCLTEARTILNQLNNKLFVAKLYTVLGLVYRGQTYYPKAEEAFLISIQHFQELADEAWRLNAVDGLAMTYLSQQKFAKAVILLEKALADLPKIIDLPNYQYLDKSLHEHMLEAATGLASSTSVN